MTTPTAKIRELLERFKTSMLVTSGHDGSLHARPMAIAEVSESGEILFVTGRHSEKSREISAENRVNVVCQDNAVFLVLSGLASLLTDRATIERAWKPAFKVWFPAGIDDPNLVVVRVRPESAEYWDNSGVNAVRYLFEAVRAMATGTTPEPAEGSQHGKVRL